MDYKNISLIGFMGSGKSTVGKILAEKLGLIFIDLDKVIEMDQEKEISNIFKIHGEKYFRELETRVIKRIYKNKNCVFACGGGVVKRKENMDLIRKNSLVVYLNVLIDDIIYRLKEANGRPLVDVENKEETIERMMEERDILYRKYANIIINNDNYNPDRTVDKILSEIKR
ncbi:MAG: shikimate kinase [Actinomycetota bacterium]|nr:shikimate kinase [Actinomycetota bacterium]